MTSLRPRSRRLRAATGLAVAGLAVAVTLTGCSQTNQITTEKEYNSSDGVGGRVGHIRAINMLVVSEAKGDPGTLLGALQNTGTDDENVALTIGDDSQHVLVPADQTVLISAPGGNSDEDENLVFDPIDVPPGAVIDLKVETKDAGSLTLQVPVLDGSLPEYADSVPSPSS